MVDNPQTISCCSPINSPNALREKTAHGTIQVGDSYCSRKRRNQKVPVRFQPFSTSPPLPLQALPPPTNAQTLKPALTPPPRALGGQTFPRGSLCAVCLRSVVPTRHSQLKVTQRPPPPQRTLCRAAAPPGLLRPRGHDRLSEPGQARLGGAEWGPPEPLSTCPVASMATSRAALQGITDTEGTPFPCICHLGSPCLQRGARQPKSRVGQAQGSTRGCRAASDPPGCPRGSARSTGCRALHLSPTGRTS